MADITNSQAHREPMTPPMTRAEKIADALVVGVLIFWFAFLGVVPQRAKSVPATPKKAADDPFAEETDLEAAG